MASPSTTLDCRKRVYLFELDSTRKTDGEIILGQKALYNEIVLNGNVVVLTFNQLLDSRGFLSLVTCESYFEHLSELFRLGAIQISQYGSIRTLVQYLLHSLENDNFIYSAIPVKNSQRRLCALMRRSLTFSDTSGIEEYLSISEKDSPTNAEMAKLQDLFTEVESSKSGDGEIAKRSSLTVQEMRDVLRTLAGMLSFAISLSGESCIYSSPRNHDEIKRFTLSFFLNTVTGLAASQPAEAQADSAESGIGKPGPDFYGLLPESSTGLSSATFVSACELLEKILRKTTQSNSRSALLKAINSQDFGAYSSEERSCAEAIVDICYNYVCELSICNISKHYNVSELNPESDNPGSPFPTNCPTFKSDFFARLLELWGEGDDWENRLATSETNEFVPFERYDEVPDFAEAVRVVEFIGKSQKAVEAAEANSSPQPGGALRSDGAPQPGGALQPDGSPQSDSAAQSNGIPRYEKGLEDQRTRQLSIVSRGIRKQVVVFLLYLVLALGVELLVNFLQNVTDDVASDALTIPSSILFVLETLLFLIISEIVSYVASKHGKEIPSVSDSLHHIHILFRQVRHLKTCNLDGHVNLHSPTGIKFETEALNQSKLLDPYLPQALRKYIAMYRRAEIPAGPIVEAASVGAGSEKSKMMVKMGAPFEDSDTYPIARISDPRTCEQVCRDEELFHRQYGVVYDSPYHKMLVDPIVRANPQQEPQKPSELPGPPHPSERPEYFPYERVLSNTTTSTEGVVVVPVYHGKFLLIEQFRHAPRAMQIAFPRGFIEEKGEPDTSFVNCDEYASDAVRELKEEIQAQAIANPLRLGTVMPDSGLTRSKAAVYVIEVAGYGATQSEEGVKRVVELTPDELDRMVADGQITDGYTLASCAMYREHIASKSH